MKATLIPSPRINKIREAVSRDAMAAEHNVFAVIHGERTAELPLFQLKLPECKHEKPCRECRRILSRLIVAAHDASTKHLHTLHREFAGVLDSLLTVYVCQGPGDTHNQLLIEKVQEVRQGLPAVPLEIPDALFAEVMVLDAPEILATLREAQFEGVRRIVQGFKHSLDQLRLSNMIGTIDWYGSDVCKYGFWRIKRCEHKSQSTATVATREDHRRPGGFGGTWSEYEVTHKVRHFRIVDLSEHHEHQLFNAARYRSPASSIRKPGAITNFIHHLPSWMHPHVFIVEGDMLRETIDECQSPVRERQEVGEELSRKIIRTGVLYSPAVTIGDYVLTGWSQADL